MIEATKIIDYISNSLASEPLDTGLEQEDDLLGSGILDSIGMMKLIAFIENEYNLKVEPDEMVIENFMTVENIVTFINSKK